MSLAHEKYAWTEHDAAEALTFIDPDCDHETWTRLAFAVKAEFGDAGFDVWNDWSKQGQKYDSKEARQKWKSAKRHGGVTIGTLIDLSMQNGWKPGTRKELSIDEIQARAAKREAEAKAEAERKRHDQAAAAARALEIWEASEPLEGNEHQYLQRKGVLSFGLNVGRWKGYENALLVPIRNADGALTSLQAIFPNTNTDLGRDRDYLKDGQKHGCFHLIGGKPVGEKPVIVVCEGYATGASIHQATGHYVAVAFDRSNLKAVAQAMRKMVGRATIIVAADNDQWEKGNPGKTDAGKAAQAVGGLVAVPEFDDLTTKPTDFNDLHKLQGIDAVRSQVQAVIPAPEEKRFLPLDSNVVPFDFPYTSDRMQPLNNWENLDWLLSQYGITARYNEISKEVEINVPGKSYGGDGDDDSALIEVTSLCARNRMPKADVADYIKLIGKENRYNPVKDFILSRPWDGCSRFADLLATIETPADYSRDLMALLMKRWLVSAVAATFEERGFWSKGILVFQGEQSLGKTSWIKALLPEEEQEKLLLVGAAMDPSNKDSVSQAIGRWIVELGELDTTFRKSDISDLKNFISRPHDVLRKPYDRRESKYKRRTVFFASVNPKHFLHDETGNVRFWTIPVTGLNYNHGIDVQQLWAEVHHWYTKGERWWLEREEEQRLEAVNADHAQVDPLEEMILARFRWDETRMEVYTEMSAAEVLIAIGYDKPTKSQATSCGNILRKLTGKEPRRTAKGRFYPIPPKELPKPQSYYDETQGPF